MKPPFPPLGLAAEGLANLILHAPHAHLFKERRALPLPIIPPPFAGRRGRRSGEISRRLAHLHTRLGLEDPVNETIPRDIAAYEEPATLEPLSLDSTINNGIDRGSGRPGSYTSAKFVVGHDSRKRPACPSSMEAHIVSDIQDSEGRAAKAQRKHRRVENAATSLHEVAQLIQPIAETLPDTIQPIWPTGETLNGFQQRLR